MGDKYKRVSKNYLKVFFGVFGAFHFPFLVQGPFISRSWFKGLLINERQVEKFKKLLETGGCL